MTDAALPQRASQLDTAYAVIFAVSFCHFLNDILQSLLAALTLC
jgi:FSR family fosmidomycin resistance protein-like MFS transporter